MRKIDSYGLKLCNYQAELFQRSLTETTCSSMIFIRRFMFSNLAKRMDTDGFLFDTTDISNALQEIEEQFGTSTYGKEKFSTEEIYWIGYIYRYWSYMSQKSSKQIYQLVKPNELRKLYFPYHSLDPEMSIERIKEAKSISDMDDLKKGVAILRKVRKKYNP